MGGKGQGGWLSGAICAGSAGGHNSKAVHRAYARKAQVVVPSLEEYERKPASGKVVALRSTQTNEAGACVQSSVGNG